MKVVHKFRLLPGPGVTPIVIDGNADILSIQWQHNGVSMWAIVDTLAHPEECQFLSVGTGGSFGPYELGKFNYLGTYQTPADEAYHVFNVTGQVAI